MAIRIGRITAIMAMTATMIVTTATTKVAMMAAMIRGVTLAGTADPYSTYIALNK